MPKPTSIRFDPALILLFHELIGKGLIPPSTSLNELVNRAVTEYLRKLAKQGKTE